MSPYRAVMEEIGVSAHPVRESTDANKPSTLRRGRLLVTVDTNPPLVYVNSGTENSPVWTPVTSEAAQRATEVLYGSVRLAQPAEDANNPIVVGENDTRFVAAVEHAGLTTGNPHNTTAADVGAAVQADLEVLADAQSAHDADPTKHVIVGTTAERTALGDPGVQGVLFLDTDIGRFYWWDDTNNEWDTAPTAPAPSYFELADIPDEFDPLPHASDHATGGPDALTAAQINALPDNVTLGAGEGIVLSTPLVADNPTISLETLDPSPAGSFNNANVVIDAQGRVVDAEDGSVSGVANASEFSPGIVYLSSDPPVGEVPRVVRVGDSAGAGFASSSLLLGAQDPLEIVGAGASADLTNNRTFALKASGLTDTYVAAGRSFHRDVADIAARDSLPTVKRGQTVYVHSTGAIYKSRSNDGTPGASVVWEDVASGASLATEASAGITKLSQAPLVAGNPIALVPHSSQFESFIEGFEVKWNSAAQVAVLPGQAWVPGVNKVVRMATTHTQTVSGQTVGWYYVYLYDNAGAAAIEFSQTAPVGYGAGTAKHKTGDNTRRYVGEFYADGAATIRKMVQINPDFIRWGTLTTSPSVWDLNVIANYNSNSEATFTGTAYGPVGTRAFELVIAMNRSSANGAPYVYGRYPVDYLIEQAGGWVDTNSTRSTFSMTIPVNASRQFFYSGTAGNNMDIWLMGYYREGR